MKRALWISLLALGCASAPKAPPAPEQVIAGRVTTDPEAKSKPKGAYGYFPLPKALSADPTKLKIPTLDFEVRAPERVVLDNGLQIYLLADRTVPMLTVSAIVWGGGFEEPADKLGVSDFAFGLLASAGAGKRTAEELDELLEFHAANAGGGSGGETSSFGIDLRSGDVDTLFPVFVDMLLRPRFQKDRCEIAIARAIEGVRRRPDSPDGLAGRALVKAIYGKDSVFAREPTEQTLRAIRVSDLEAFRKKILSPKSTVLLVSGDFEREKLLGLVKTHLGGWRGGERIARSYPPSAPLTRRVVFVPKEVAQTKIRIGGYGFQRRSPEEFALRVLNTALGGGLGAGRLYREIREAKGLAYSAYSVVAPGPTRGLFYAGADTRPEQTADAIAAMLSTLDGVTGPQPLQPAELSVAADMYLNAFAFRFDSAGKIVQEKAVFDLFDYPQDYLETFRDNVAKVDLAAATQAARALIHPDELQLVVVGPRTLRDTLARFGPVTVIEDVEAFR